LYRIVAFDKETDTCITYVDLWYNRSDVVSVESTTYNIITEFELLVHDIVVHVSLCADFVGYLQNRVIAKPPEEHQVDITLTNLTMDQVAYIMDYLK